MQHGPWVISRSFSVRNVSGHSNWMLIKVISSAVQPDVKLPGIFYTHTPQEFVLASYFKRLSQKSRWDGKRCAYWKTVLYDSPRYVRISENSVMGATAYITWFLHAIYTILEGAKVIASRLHWSLCCSPIKFSSISSAKQTAHLGERETIVLFSISKIRHQRT